ncbi:DUF421 domain-containing protein [Bacillus carboniphilus]|uniref:DUF421 domain-containing protein n=1 Tax=Bacillus carboniphilus TaxID=86663 RepID=A0ABN0W300_9BACI
MNISEMLIRTFVTFFVLYILSRVLGKKLISRMTFFDFVAGVTLGSIAGSLIYSSNISLFVALTGLVCFALLALILDMGTFKFLRFGKIANGEPMVLIQNGMIREKEMAKAHLTMNELLFLLRKKDAFYLDEVDLAIWETDGTLSVLKKVQNQPMTQIHQNAKQRGLTNTLIMDGKIMEENLKIAGKDKSWLLSTIKEHGYHDVSEVSICEIDELDHVYIDKKDNK